MSTRPDTAGFLRGIARIMDFRGVLLRQRLDEPYWVRDEMALRSDWVSVGRSIVIGEHAAEQELEGSAGAR